MKDRIFWSIYAPYISEFIDFKRSLGYKYGEQERILSNFDKFILEHGYNSIGLSKEVTDKWSERHHNESELTIYNRMVCITQFSGYLRNLGIKSYIPQLPKYPGCTFIPYIYSYEEMAVIFEASDNLRLRQRNMGSSLFIMPCLLRMLYATGIRIGEALALQNKDVNFHDRCLILSGTKNGKDRLVPFTNTLTDVCMEYIDQRNAFPVIGIAREDNPFFVSPNGLRCKHGSIYRWFRKIIERAGIPFVGSKHGPRIHDIRHSFACHSFIKLSDQGMDLYCSWPYLSTYLGHQSLGATEQYVRLTAQLYPELLKDADRLYVDILPQTEDQQKVKL